MKTTQNKSAGPWQAVIKHKHKVLRQLSKTWAERLVKCDEIRI